MIICNDGTWGCCQEHSIADGVVPRALFEKISNQIDNSDAKYGRAFATAHHYTPSPKRLEWTIPPEISHKLIIAAQNVDKLIDDFEFLVYRYRGYGKTFIKSRALSPDNYIQLALQVAYYK